MLSISTPSTIMSCLVVCMLLSHLFFTPCLFSCDFVGDFGFSFFLCYMGQYLCMLLGVVVDIEEDGGAIVDEAVEV